MFLVSLFLMFSKPTVSRLLFFHIFLKKKPPYIFTLKARNIQRERKERETERETERERDRERDREKERHLKKWRNWRNYRKEKREDRRENREESGHTVPALPLFFYPLDYILATVKPVNPHFEPIPLPPFQKVLILCGFYPYY